MKTTIATLEKHLEQINDPGEKLDSIDTLVRELWPRQPDRALTLAENACTFAQTTGDPTLRARALETLGYVSWQKSDFPRAMTHLLEALNLARSGGDRSREVSILNRMAVISYDLGNYPDSLGYLYKLLPLAEALDELERQACALNDIGYLHLMLDQPAEALPYLQESLTISQQHGYQNIEAAVLDSLGQVYHQTGDYEQSLRFAQECLALARQAGLIRSEIEVLITLGKTYAALGQTGQALSYANTALSLAHEAENHNLEISALVEKSKIYLSQRNSARATAQLSLALNIAEQAGKKRALYEIHQMLADIYAQSGDYQRALEHHQQFHALKEAVFNDQTDHQLMSLQVMHEVEQTRQQAEIYELKNVELQRQITEKERLIADLDAFASMVAHDLKSPLSVLVANAELIARDAQCALSDDAQQYLHDLLHMGYKMGHVIDDLLVLAGVRREDLTPEPVHMAAIIVDVQKRLARLIKRRAAAIIIPDDWPVALGHAGLIEEVWANYISNAIKYGGDPPIVTLGATPQPDGTICYWVKDNGDGINPQHQHRLFTEYTRLNRDHAADGNGLGLAIVKRIMDRLGGECDVASAGLPGKGCTFTFILPAAQ